MVVLNVSDAIKLEIGDNDDNDCRASQRKEKRDRRRNRAEEHNRKNESKRCAKIAAGVVVGLARYKIMKQKLDLKGEEMGAPISEASSDVVYSVSCGCCCCHCCCI